MGKKRGDERTGRKGKEHKPTERMKDGRGRDQPPDSHQLDTVCQSENKCPDQLSSADRRQKSKNGTHISIQINPIDQVFKEREGGTTLFGALFWPH